MKKAIAIMLILFLATLSEGSEVMADKNIQMAQRNSADTGWDNLYPITKSENIEFQNNEGNEYVINNPYKNGGTLHIKGQLHCHTTGSDGADAPVALVTAYKNAGYGFITITDHNVITPDPGVSGIIWIGNSVEESYLRHVNAFDVGNDYSGLQSSQEVISYHKNKGRMTSLNHPNWQNQYILDEFEIKSYYDHNFIEVYNAVVDGYGEEQWDWALSANRIVFGTATDDCHDVSGAAFNKGWVVVHVGEATKAAILQSLRDGNFYASTGNDITITLDGNVITASSSAVSNFTFIGRNGRVLKTVNGVTSAAYTILGNESYVRVKSEITSNATKKAFSQPIFIETQREQYINADIYKNMSLYGIGRQALDNGGFDIWERGELFTFGATTAGGAMTADRWAYVQNPAFAVMPEATIFKMPMQLDYVPFASNSLRISYDTVGNAASENDYYSILHQVIEEGTKKLCAISKQITFSFYARSSIPSKKIAVDFRLNYGTGGTPSPQVDIPGKVFNLTSYWKRYSVTITLPDVFCASFGTNEDSFIRPTIWCYWGSGFNTRLATSEAEFPSSIGYVDFAAMTLNATDIKLPYMPKGAEELRNCQRHYIKSKVPGNSARLYCVAISSNAVICNYTFPQPMMKTPTVNVSYGNVANQIRATADGALLTATSVTAEANKNMVSVITFGGLTLTPGAWYEFDIEAETGY